MYNEGLKVSQDEIETLANAISRVVSQVEQIEGKLTMPSPKENSGQGMGPTPESKIILFRNVLNGVSDRLMKVEKLVSELGNL